MDAIHAHPRALELLRAEQPPPAGGERRPQARRPVARAGLGEAREGAGYVPLRRAQAYEQEQLWPAGTRLREHLPFGIPVGAQASGGGLHPPAAGARTCRLGARHCAVDPHKLHVGLERLNRRQQVEHPRALALLREPRIGRGPDRKGGPGVVGALAVDAVAVDEPDRRPACPHRTCSRAPGASSISWGRASRRPGSPRSSNWGRPAIHASAPPESSQRSWATATSTAPGPT